MSKSRLIVTSVISIVCVAILLIGSTYSIFTSTEVDDTANVYTTGNLKIDYKEGSSNVTFTDITPMNEEEADGITPYRITVTNKGNVPYMFDVILSDTTSSSSNTIDYQYIMTKVGYLEPKSLNECENNIIKEDVILPAGESVDIDVRVWISDKVQNSEIGKSFYSKLAIDGLAIYDDSTEINNDILSLRYISTPSNDFTDSFRNVNYQTYIKTASFVDYIDTGNAVEYWDLTTNTDVNKNKVIAWVENNGTIDDEGKSYYDLYIGSKENIYAKSLVRFFENMTSLESISFDNLDTSLTTGMGYMFTNCRSLTSLDVSSFDTKNVTNMQRMFMDCKSLEVLDLSNFDTSKVSGEWGMQQIFRGCISLESLDLSNWNTSKITSMHDWFMNCESLKTLDLSSFDTSNVTSMSGMFEYCFSLESIKLSNANFSNVTEYGLMFHGVPSNVTIYVTDEEQASWLTERFTNLTNVIY